MNRLIMRKFLMIILVCFIPVDGMAQEIPLSTDSRKGVLPDVLKDSWIFYRVALKQGKDQEAFEFLKTLNEKAKGLGIENSEALSTALLWDAQEAKEGENYVLALELSRCAQQISPNYPVGYFARGRIFFDEDPKNLLQLINEYSKGWIQTSRHIWSILYGINAGVFGILVTGSIASLIFIGSLIFRYTPRITHLIYEIAQHKLKTPTIYMLVGVILIGPLWFRLGLVWAAIWWLIIFWVFMTIQERMVALVFVVLTASAGVWLPAWISIGKVMEADDFRIIAQSAGGELGILVGDMGMDKVDESDGLYAMALGLQYRHSREYGFAAEMYHLALKSMPDDERILVNLGNLSFLESDIDQSIDFYQKAIKINPNSVEAHYNMAQASREKLSFEEGQRHYEDAKRLDLKLTEFYTSRSAIEGGLPVMDASINLYEVLARGLMFRTEEVKAKADNLFTLLLNVSISSAPLIGLLFGAILMLLSPRSYIKRLSFQCTLCGRMICQSCQKHIFHLKVCHSCSGENKHVKRFSELRQFEKRRDRQIAIARFSSILAPGIGHLYLTYSIKGFVFVFLFVALIVWFFSGNFPFSIPYAWMVTDNSGSIMFLMGGLVVLYGVTFWDLARLHDLLGGEELWH